MTNFKYSTNITHTKFDFLIVIILCLMIVVVVSLNITKFFDIAPYEYMFGQSVQSAQPVQSVQSVQPAQPIQPTQFNNTDIKLIDVVSTEFTASEENLLNDNETNKSEYDDSKFKENFANIKDYPDLYSKETTHILSGVINSDKFNKYINIPTIYSTKTNSNYNTVNEPPILFSPDIDVPNKADKLKEPNEKGYYFSKVKLIENSNSPLMKLYKRNLNQINKTIAQCTLDDSKRIPDINGPFDGYNAYVDLKTDSFANVTSIGKSMLSPYTSYPVPS